jgi:type VI secretion system protein ImpH
VRAYVGFEVGYAVNPVLARDAVPPLALTPPGKDARPLLGWNTWLPTSRAMPRRTDAGDALFESEIVEGRA